MRGGRPTRKLGDHSYPAIMTQDARPYGLALIGGTLAGLVTMASHPTGHGLLADFERVAPINQGVHALAIAGTIVTVIGLVGLRRELATRQVLADAALVSYAFGAISVMFAAIASGLIQTDVAAMVLEGGDAARATWDPFGEYTYVFNQAATKVFVVTAS